MIYTSLEATYCALDSLLASNELCSLCSFPSAGRNCISYFAHATQKGPGCPGVLLAVMHSDFRRAVQLFHSQSLSCTTIRALSLLNMNANLLFKIFNEMTIRGSQIPGHCARGARRREREALSQCFLFWRRDMATARPAGAPSRAGSE